MFTNFPAEGSITSLNRFLTPLAAFLHGLTIFLKYSAEKLCEQYVICVFMYYLTGIWNCSTYVQAEQNSSQGSWIDRTILNKEQRWAISLCLQQGHLLVVHQVFFTKNHGLRHNGILLKNMFQEFLLWLTYNEPHQDT